MFSILVPPLRELASDKTLLLDHLRNLFAKQGGSVPFALNSAAFTAWTRYAFPGNVRELKNIVIRLTTKFAGHELGVPELEAEFDLECDLGGSDREPLTPVSLADEARARLVKQKGFSLDDMLRIDSKAYDGLRSRCVMAT